MDELITILQYSGEAMYISALVTIGAGLAISEWRSNKLLIGSGFCCGVIVGIIGRQTGVGDGYDNLITALAVVTGPTFFIQSHGKSPADMIKEIGSSVPLLKRFFEKK